MSIIKRILLVPVIGFALFLTGCMDMYSDYSAMEYDAPTKVTSSQPQSSKRTYSFPSHKAATGQKEFIFDPKHKMWAAYDANGNLVNQGAASGGKSYCSDIKRACRTPVGSFRVTRKKGAACKSSIYPVGKGGAPMPYCTFFNGGYAIHGSPDVPNYNASHGCVRVLPSDAQWLSNNFLSIGTRVKVLPY